jgi:hypothetical protein
MYEFIKIVADVRRPSDDGIVVSFVLLLIAIDIILWLPFIYFVLRPIIFSNEEREVVLRRLIRMEFFLGSRIFWISNPEIELDTAKRIEKRRKFEGGVHYMAVNYIILAALSLIIGLFNITSDFLAFLYFSAFGLLGALVSAHYLFLWHLMKSLDYQNLGILDD